MKISYSKQDILLTISIFIFTSYLFLIYFVETDILNNTVLIQDGFYQRTLTKISGVFLLYFTLIRFFSIRIFLHNFPIKIPLLYYMITVIFATPFLLLESNLVNRTFFDLEANLYLMANNLVIFAPLLFLNFSGEKGDQLFTQLIKIIVWSVSIQLLLDLFLKFLNFQKINTILGGMGNANTFGLHLIIAALGLRFIYHKYLLSSIVLIFTFGTGSLICILISILLLVQNIIFFVFRKSIIFFLTFSFSLVILIFFKDNLIFLFSSSFFSTHGYLKLKGFFSEHIFELLSIKGRLYYIMEGLKMMIENPLSIIFGHPNFLLFFSGDFFYITILITLGAPTLLFFIISHIYLVFRGLNIKTPLFQFSSYTLIIYLIIFSTNRILDYWPSGFMYLLVFTYLATKNRNVKKKFIMVKNK